MPNSINTAPMPKQRTAAALVPVRASVGRWRLSICAALLAFAVAATSATLAPAASASTKEKSCSAGGFTGTLRIDYSRISAGAVKIIQITAKINKGSQRSGGYGYSAVTDNGVLPRRTFRRSITQNNGWESLYGGGVNGYTTASPGGGFSIYFKFNKAFALDPSCNTYLNL